jgi:hypothetical protein
MKDLRKELLNEKMQVHPNKKAIQFLQRVLDGHPVTKREFIDTMVVKLADWDLAFALGYDRDCVEVLSYAGGFDIQVLIDRDYLYESFDNQESDEMHTKVKSREIKDILSFIWRYEADQLFNKSK